MKKFFTSILMIGLCAIMSAQSVNISGVVTNADGTGAEGVYLSLLLVETDEPFIIESGVDGSYEFTIDLEDENTEGCFELLFLDLLQIALL